MSRLTYQARQELIQERRKQILAAAARVFAAKGYERATIRDVAQSAGLAEGSIYNYFKNKQDLLIHLPREFVQPRLEAFVSTHNAGDTTPDELLHFIAQNMAEVMSQNRELMRVLLTSLPTMDDALRAEFLNEMPNYALNFLETYLREQQAANALRPDVDVEVAARAFPGMMLFFMLIQELLQPTNMPRIPFDRVIPQVVQLYLHGILPAPAVITPPKKAPAKNRRMP